MQNLILWAPADSVGNATNRKPRGTFNSTFLDNLAEAEKVGKGAQETDYASMLENTWHITPAMVTQMLTLAGQTGGLLRGAQSSHAQSSVSSADKDDAERRIIAAIRRIQAGARRQFGTNKEQLKRFFISVDLDTAEEQLDEMAETILQILTTESLMGVGPTQTHELEIALMNWNQFATSQDDLSDAGVSANAGVKANMALINATRRAIQASIDGEFPYIAKRDFGGNIQARTLAREKFDLPVNHPFK